MKDPADFEFADELLEQRIRQAFDQVEPSEQAQERMLANLLAYAQEKSADGAGSPEDPAVLAAAAPASIEEAVSRAPQAPSGGTTSVEPVLQGFSAEAAEVVRGARESAPRARRRIRPWQVLVPTAAVLAVVGIAVVSGQLMGGLSVPDAVQEASLEADSAQGEGGKQAMEAPEQVDSASEEGLQPEDEAAADTPEESASSQALIEGNADYQQFYGDGLEPIWAHEFPNIEAESGQRFAIDNPQAPVAANPATVGNLLVEGKAYGTDEGVAVPCEVYSSLDENVEYLICYSASDECYPAHAVQSQG